MLFNSYEFILLFLPITLLGYLQIIGKFGMRPAIAWLVLASLLFYGWWNPYYLGLLIPSMTANYFLGRYLTRAAKEGLSKRKLVLILSVAANLAAIGYFKYAGFLVTTIGGLAGTGWTISEIVLPLAISFFTFQQIAYLVDCHRGIAGEKDPVTYALFVCFFPQLIAGPIVHHSEMMPQFKTAKQRDLWLNISVGISIFAIGLFKKVVLADTMAGYASPGFDQALSNPQIDFVTAWQGALAYTFQLYFDFSGYSDMAIGAARLFGIKMPVNFFSPYKALNIIDFWRRWHMTLSRFLRDYVYFALGGNRKGSARRYANLLTTMLLGGLWHGAGWTFVLWGALHGSYLVICHAWHRIKRPFGDKLKLIPEWVRRGTAWLTTFTAVVIGWVYFRAENFDAANNMVSGMIGLNGAILPYAISARAPSFGRFLESFGFTFTLGGGGAFILAWAWIVTCLVIARFMPNSIEITRDFDPVIEHGILDENKRATRGQTRSTWSTPKVTFTSLRLSRRWGWAMAVVLGLGLLGLSRVSEFLYFQF